MNSGLGSNGWPSVAQGWPPGVPVPAVVPPGWPHGVPGPAVMPPGWPSGVQAHFPVPVAPELLKVGLLEYHRFLDRIRGGLS